MSKTYIGLAFSAQMLSKSCKIAFDPIAIETVCVDRCISCANPTHKASLDALNSRYGINVPVAEKAPKVSLETGDAIIVLQISGLPRETREFTAEEVAKASFKAVKFTVLE